MEDRELVRQGALYMDCLKSDWWEHIDPLALKMQETCNCIMGQNDLPWIESLPAGETVYGDPLRFAFCGEHKAVYWLEEIAVRMESSRVVAEPRSVRA